MNDQISDKDFERLRKRYGKINESFEDKLIFNVGCDMGLFSELGGMMETMMYCYHHRIRFVPYADNANFSGEKGWEDFFEPFCRFDHNPLNRKVNFRQKRGDLKGRIMDRALRATSGADYLTYDIFDKAIGEFKDETVVDWPEMGIHGTTWPEYHKLIKLALRFNRPTREAVDRIKAELGLPKSYTSIQIRGGDKIEEFTELLGVEQCVSVIERIRPDVRDLFVFTDDYANVARLRKMKPHWAIHTLTGSGEKGYRNWEFNRKPWEFRKANLLKLFAMVELCIESDFHFGCEQACVNNVIRSCRDRSTYHPLMAGEPQPDKVAG